MKKLINLEPVAKKTIDKAKKQGAIVLMCVDGFQTDFEALCLRDMLWYARKNGVVIHFIPEKKL